MIVGYVRVSTADQHQDRQLEQLRPLVGKLFCDEASGKDKCVFVADGCSSILQFMPRSSNDYPRASDLTIKNT